MRRPFFTAEELEEIRRADAEMSGRKPKTGKPPGRPPGSRNKKVLTPEEDEARRERRREYMREYYKNHREQMKAYSRAYYQSHQDQLRAYHRNYDKRTPEQKRESSYRYYIKNREAILRKRKEKYAEREDMRNAVRERQERNKKLRRVEFLNTRIEELTTEREALMEELKQYESC